MSELELHRPQSGWDGSPQQTLVQWASAARAAHELAEALCRTEFVPEHFRNKPAESTAAILHGAEIGLTPLQALQGIYVIYQRPALYAKVKLAITQAHGHSVWTEEQSPSRAIVCGRRAGSEKIERVTWTLDRAQKAGYTKRNPNYDKDPQSMLWNRAVSNVCDRIASDALAGLGTVEELEDEQQTEQPTHSLHTPAPIVQTTGRTAQRAPLRPVANVPLPEPDAPQIESKREPVEPSEPEPPLPEPPSDEPLDIGVETGEQISKEQLRKLHTTFSKLNIDEREDRLAIANTLLALSVGSSKELTHEQASTLIDAISSAKTEDLLALVGKPGTGGEPGTHQFRGMDPDDPCDQCGAPYEDVCHGSAP